MTDMTEEARRLGYKIEDLDEVDRASLQDFDAENFDLVKPGSILDPKQDELKFLSGQNWTLTCLTRCVTNNTIYRRPKAQIKAAGLDWLQEHKGEIASLFYYQRQEAELADKLKRSMEECEVLRGQLAEVERRRRVVSAFLQADYNAAHDLEGKPAG